MQIWEQSVISPNFGVESLISQKKGDVSVIYPYIYFLKKTNVFIYSSYCNSKPKQMLDILDQPSSTTHLGMSNTCVEREV